MRQRNAAPEANLPADLEGSANNSGAASLPLTSLHLPAHIVSRLEAHGLRTVQDWTELGDERFRVFGVTRAMARLVDQAVKK